MNAAQLLNQYQVTMDQAKDWIMSHLYDPALVFNTARSIGLTSNMLAEIVAPVVPGVTAQQVEDFFTAQGLAGFQLRGSIVDTTPPADSREFLPEDMAALSSLVTMNTHSGVLSTEALRKAALDNLSNDANYYALFNPASYQGAADQYFSGAELGIAGHAGFAATTANLESVYYGTVINTIQAIDYSEIQAINAFTKKYDVIAIEARPDLYPKQANELFALLQSVFEDPASPPIYTDQTLAQIIVQSTVGMAGEISNGDGSALFDGILSSYF
ncbi:hypothetical protein [Chitinibacter sp. GC72]|uniref:hypothetical protein n=1 Tax=Chitinibacter sp. GC72 TaxID=1526917 RepID=UPI0012F8653F|nr:hypothetical protein [Chitinibacter sp. GC72]